MGSITTTAGATPLGPAIDKLEARGIAVAGVLDEVEKRLRDQVQTSAAFVEQSARYLMDAGGKRFRPLLVALVSHLGDPDDPRIPDAGVIVELVHLATLYHDDVIDEADARRGIEAAHLRWDNTTAILTGDYLFARASELSAELGVEVTRIIARTIAILCEGQIREVMGSRGALPPDVEPLVADEEHYLKVVRDKTASLIATSCRYGALLSGLDEEQVEALTQYGWDIGMAFQLSDDVLDIASDHEDSGKVPGTDLREGVHTLPVLYAMEDDETGELTRILDQDHLSEADVARALELLRSGTGLKRATERAREFADRAVTHLAGFPRDKVTEALRDLAAFTVARVG